MTTSSSYSTDAQSRALSDLFGDDAVACALNRRRSSFQGTVLASDADPNLCLAIGIIRTVMNEKKVSPGDVRRIAKVLEVDISINKKEFDFLSSERDLTIVTASDESTSSDHDDDPTARKEEDDDLVVTSVKGDEDLVVTSVKKSRRRRGLSKIFSRRR